MASLPEDVRVALGATPPEGDWARIRSSPGSVVGETYLFLRPTPHALTRGSALDPLRAIPLDGPPTLEEAEFDAWVLLPTGGQVVKLEVGYLDRDAVRALFVPPVAEPASAPSLELVDARGALVDLLADRVRAGGSPLERTRARLLRLLRLRRRPPVRRSAPRQDPGPDREKARPPAPVVAPPEETEVAPPSTPSTDGPNARAFLWLVIGFVLAAIAYTIANR